MDDFTHLDPTEEAFNVLRQSDYSQVEKLCICIDADVESWFTSTIACCDACIDEYKAEWPNAYQHDESFQDNCMNFDTFYEGSKIIFGWERRVSGVAMGNRIP